MTMLQWPRHLARALGHCVLYASLPLMAAGAQAQTFPERAITLVTPAPPGGGTDALTRALADALAKRLPVPVVVENRPGANATIAAAYVSRAPADGYTLLGVTSGHTINPAIFKKLSYDAVKDFAAVSRLATAPAVLVANKDLGIGNFAQLRELARTKPQQLTFASSETSIQLMTHEVGTYLDAPQTVVYYKGTGPSINDVLGGHVSFAVTSIASVLPFIESGRLSAIGVTGSRRSSLLPQVPTFQEQGVQGMDTETWQGIVAPAGTPPETIAFLNQKINEALADPEVQARCKALAYEPSGITPEEFAEFLKADVVRQAKAVAEAGIQPQ